MNNSKKAKSNMKSSELKEKSINLIQNLSIHGASRIVSSRSWIQSLFWIIIVLCAWAYSSITIVGYFIEYFNYSAITFYERRIIYKFPAVKFCGHDKTRIKCQFNQVDCPEDSIVHLPNNLLTGFHSCSVFNSGDLLNK